MSAPKESGDLEYDCAGLIYLEVESAMSMRQRPGRLHVAKNRFGPAGQTIGLAFDGWLGEFAEQASSAFSALENRVIEAVRAGASTKDAVVGTVRGNRQATLRVIQSLLSAGVLTPAPLAVAEAIRAN